MGRKTSIREVIRAKGYFDNKLVIIPRHQQLIEGIATQSSHQRTVAKSDSNCGPGGLESSWSLQLKLPYLWPLSHKCGAFTQKYEDIYLYPLQKCVLQVWWIKKILETEASFEARGQYDDVLPVLMGRSRSQENHSPRVGHPCSFWPVYCSSLARGETEGSFSPSVVDFHICRMEIITYA